jgi:hypothetical protein
LRNVWFRPLQRTRRSADLPDSIIAAQEREIAIMEPHAGGMHH